MKKISKSVKKSNYYEILEDVGPIPKGIYLAVDQDQDSVAFTTGEKILFAIFGHWREKVRSIPPNIATITRTKQADFLDRYYELLEESRRKGPQFNPSEPLTMCFIDPSVAREVN